MRSLGGLALVGTATWMISRVVYAIPENLRCGSLVSKAEGKLVLPEQRLVSATAAARFHSDVSFAVQIWTPFE